MAFFGAVTSVAALFVFYRKTTMKKDKKKMKNSFVKSIIAVFVFGIVILFSACQLPQSNNGGGSSVSGENGATPYIQNGYWYINGTNTGVKAEGTNGTNGVDGKTPYIKNGYWYINGTNTGVKAEGTNGTNGVGIKEITVNEDGKLVITLTDGSVLDPIEIPTDAGHKHDFGEWVNYSGNANVSCENRLFYHICKECKALEWQSGSYESHDFDTVTTEPTCVSEGYDENTCSVCGLVEITNRKSTVEHEYEAIYSYDNSFHWYDCKNCDVTTAYGEHNIDDSGYCTVCDNPAGATVGILYDVSADGTYAEVIGYSGSAKRIVIADTYNGVPVTSIYEKAFYNNDNITSVVIPDSVTSIGGYAFAYCSSLTSVTIPDSVTSIGDFAFNCCSSLTSVTIPDSVTSIGDYAFNCCSSLTSVVIGDSVTSIGSSAFEGCDGLMSVTIPNSVTSIGYCAFSGCDGLMSVTIPNSVTSIGYGAFNGCHSSLYTEYEYGKYVKSGDNPYAILIELTNKNLSTYTIHEDTKYIGCDVFAYCSRLTSITIPDSVTSIIDYAFFGCSSLTSITIPDSVTSIGESAFAYCYSLTDVYYTGSEAEWSEITINNGNSYLTNATIHYNYVPEE